MDRTSLLFVLRSIRLLFRGLRLLLPLEIMGMFLVSIATRDNIEDQELYKTDPATHWLWHSEELAPSLTRHSTLENRSFVSTRL